MFTTKTFCNMLCILRLNLALYHPCCAPCFGTAYVIIGRHLLDSSRNANEIRHLSILYFISAKSLAVVNTYARALIVFQQEHAFENSQKYKEGKFIIEMAHMIKDNGWL